MNYFSYETQPRKVEFFCSCKTKIETAKEKTSANVSK